MSPKPDVPLKAATMLGLGPTPACPGAQCLINAVGWMDDRLRVSTFIFSLLGQITQMLVHALPLCTCCSFSCSPFFLVAPSSVPPLLTVPHHKQCLLLPLCPSEPNRTQLPNWTSFFMCLSPPYTVRSSGEGPRFSFLSVALNTWSPHEDS